MKLIRKCILFDIDDTLLTAQNIYIKKMLNGKITNLTSQQFANENKTGQDAQYSFDEYNCPVKVKNSIINAIPIYANLKLLARYSHSGYDIGLLTARKLEDTVHLAMNEFLTANLNKNYTVRRDLVFAINDPKYFKHTNNSNDSDSNASDSNESSSHAKTSNLKLSVLRELIRTRYSDVVLVDDSIDNVLAIRESGLCRVKAIHYNVKCNENKESV